MLGAEVQHLLRFGDATDQRAGQAVPSEDKCGSRDRHRMLGHAQLDQRAVELQQAELKDYTYELLFELYDNKVEYWDF